VWRKYEAYIKYFKDRLWKVTNIKIKSQMKKLICCWYCIKIECRAMMAYFVRFGVLSVVVLKINVYWFFFSILFLLTS
jgi:hypothetical protein